MTSTDYDAIDRLHRIDEEASRKGDFTTLASLLSDDVVVMAPGTKAVRGIATIREQMHRMRPDDGPRPEVLSYALGFEEVTVAGDYAFEWGTISGETRMPDGDVVASRFNVMRILRRQDGTWKVHRTIWNEQK